MMLKRTFVEEQENLHVQNPNMPPVLVTKMAIYIQTEL